MYSASAYVCYVPRFRVKENSVAPWLAEELLTVTTLPSSDKPKFDFDRKAASLSERWPKIQPYQWCKFDYPLLVAERDGCTPLLVPKSLADECHAAPVPKLDVGFRAISRSSSGDRLIYLIASDYERDAPSTERLACDDKEVLDRFHDGHPVPLPFLRWTYGQSILLANVVAAERLDLHLCIDLVLFGCINHF